MPIKTVDKRKDVDIKVGNLPKGSSFTLIGSNEVLIIMEPDQQYHAFAQCFNISKSSKAQIENHLGVCPCDIEIIILDKESKNVRGKA